ncbi:hypothetical protein CHRYSEO8AT_300021 [Chryseobacterium sp. 8AT]|nr:hypothetical protein CHRYSEO8AT_300021 [Chryseobacterium sp. 8AT]
MHNNGKFKKESSNEFYIYHVADRYNGMGNHHSCSSATD